MPRNKNRVIDGLSRMPIVPLDIIDKTTEGDIKEFVNLYLNAIASLELEGWYSEESQ